jgi:hypothetical protein
VVLTGPQATVSTAPVPPSGHQTRDAVAALPADPANAQVPDAPKAPASPAPSAIGFTLHFDADMQRLILEVREPTDGFVIFQTPTKYVIKQFFASSGNTAPSPRGARVNSAV